jgi:hypothetical protein
MNLSARVAKLEEQAAGGPAVRCPRCGQLTTTAALQEHDPHSREGQAEQRRLQALSPEEFRAEYRAAFGFELGEWPAPAPDDEIYQPVCWRCGNNVGAPLTWGEILALPWSEQQRLLVA